MDMVWVVYMIECGDGSIYTGLTSDIERRWLEHRDAVGSKYSKSHQVLKLLWKEVSPDRVSAEKREAQIKRWTRGKKLALAAGDIDLLKRLSHRQK